MTREKPAVATKLVCFTDRIVSLAQETVVGEPNQAFEAGVRDYVDWEIVVIHGLGEYSDHTYRRWQDVLQDMYGIVS